MKSIKLIIIFSILFFLLNIIFSDSDVQEIIVQKGETLWSLSKKYLNDPNKWKEFLKYNNINNPNKIQPGMKLLIPFELSKSAFGKASYIIGDSYYKSFNFTNWAKVKEEQNFYNGDYVKTEKDSELEIELLDKTIIKIFENTIVKLEINSKEKQTFIRRVYLDIGKLFTKGEHKYEFSIQTEAGVAAVRGTEFLCEYSNNMAKVVVYKGKVSLSAQGKEVIINEGEASTVKKGEQPVTPFKLPQPPEKIEIKTK